MAGMPEFRDPEHKQGLPDHTFKDTLTLFSGDDVVDLRYFGAAHTDGDAFIVFRRLGVIHVGDTFPGVNVVARDGGSAAGVREDDGESRGGCRGDHDRDFRSRRGRDVAGVRRDRRRDAGWPKPLSVVLRHSGHGRGVGPVNNVVSSTKQSGLPDGSCV